MNDGIFEKLKTEVASWFGGEQGSEQAGVSAVQRAKEAAPLVKDRPVHLERRYDVLTEEETVDDLFLRMRRFLYETASSLETDGPASRRGGPNVVFKQAGKLSSDRRYFFLQPLNASGWLFERSGSGWLVSKANQIVGKDMFVRQGEPRDVVTLYAPTSGEGLPRVSSRWYGGELIPFSVYEQKLETILGLAGQEATNARVGDAR